MSTTEQHSIQQDDLTMTKYTQKAMGHFCVVMMKAVSMGPRYGDRMMNAAQMLIFRALS